jgi:AbrB family looped-hinge helix DNA binding protein
MLFKRRMMTITAKIASKCQITLPQKVRDILHVHEGDVVVFEQEGDKLVIRPARSLLDYQGYLQGRTGPAGVDAVRKAAKKYIGKKQAGRMLHRPVKVNQY